MKKTIHINRHKLIEALIESSTGIFGISHIIAEKTADNIIARRDEIIKEVTDHEDDII